MRNPVWRSSFRSKKSHSYASGVLTLHCVHAGGKCKKLPGEHYKVYDKWGDFIPPEREFDVVCRACFKGGIIAPPTLAPEIPGLEEEEDLASSSSSSDSDSSASSADVNTGASPLKRRKQ